MFKKINKLLLALLLVGLVGCQKQSNIDLFVGKWDANESLLEDSEVYTGFLRLRVEEDNTFSINPGISGTMDIIYDEELVLDCDTEDFDPPPGWMGIEYQQNINYQFVSDNELRLTYIKDNQSYTLIFTREY